MTNQNDLAQQHSQAWKRLNHWEERYAFYSQLARISKDTRWKQILDDIYGKICKLKEQVNER